jgi:hypothetical protein
MVHLVVLVLFVGLSASTARLAMHDTITVSLRKKLFVKYGEKHFVNRMLECFRCTAFWTTMPITALVVAGYAAFTPVTWWMSLIAFLPVNKAVAYYAFLLFNRE